jgi:capsular exopolysaccharide synthesis family protein
MAKVYDALRRAEEERRKHSDIGVQPIARLEWEPEVAAEIAHKAPKAVQAPRESLFRRLWPKRAAEEGAADYNKRRISQLQPNSYIAEQFRALRGRIDALETPERRIRTIAVTSAVPGEGKTTASVNLALVTALSLGRRVLLIDCDLRRPRVHSALGLHPKSGLSEVLNGEVRFEEAVAHAEGADLDVLSVRDRPVNPSELLGSPAMRDLITAVAKRYDRVILDTPAALGLPDAKAVGDLCDGLIMVVRADKTRQEDVQSVLEILGRGRMLGVVLNGTSVDQSRYGYQS